MAARVPDTFEQALDLGMDVQAWMDRDLIDMLIAGGGYAPSTLDAASFCDRDHPYGLPVYPCINQGPVRMVSNGRWAEAERALATNWYEAGADGVYVWNYGTPFEYKSGLDLVRIRQQAYTSLNDIGDRNALSGKDKLFFVDHARDGVLQYYAIISGRPPLPATAKLGTITSGVIQRFPLDVGENIKAAISNGLGPSMKLTTALKGKVHIDWLEFRLNGDVLTNAETETIDGEQSQCKIQHPIKSPPLRRGRNYIQLAFKPEDGVVTSSLTITAIELELAFTSNPGRA